MLPFLLLLVAAAAAPKPSPAIAVAPFVGQAAPAGTPVRISGAEFELLILNNYTGPVTWDVTTPDGSTLPVKWFQCKPKTVIIGVRAGQPAPAEFETPDGPAVAVYAAGSGRAVVAAWGVADGRPVKLATMLIDANRGPMPPPPGPDPPPGPTPTPAPIPQAGFRVAIIEESSERPRLPAKQLAILFSPKVRDYLNDKCVTGPGGTKEWRIFDKDSSMANESPIWQAVMQRPRRSVPWIVISNGTTGTEEPLPPDEESVLALLRKYGG
ncbi:MAG: hypothetical protein K1X57_19995 [Gemmataceae bacterium]|nr:hypothetical protein [Gemmataceae bacterium]